MKKKSTKIKSSGWQLSGIEPVICCLTGGIGVSAEKSFLNKKSNQMVIFKYKKRKKLNQGLGELLHPW